MGIATMKAKFIIAVFISALAAFKALAAERTQDALNQKSIFGISFENGASVYVNSATVTSISKQEYILGTLFVSEIVIDTTGNSQIRIYNSSPLDPTKIKEKMRKVLPTQAQAAAEVASYAEMAKGHIEDTSQMNLSGVTSVYKEYPVTTHSKTLEFAVSTPEELDSLYELLIADFTGTSASKDSDQKDKSDDSKPAKLGGSLYKIKE